MASPDAETRSPWLTAQETTYWSQDPPTSIPNLCDICAAIDFEEMFTMRENESYGTFEARRYQHHNSRASLSVAAGAGCDLCRLLDRSLVLPNTTAPESDADDISFALGPGYGSSFLYKGMPMTTHDFRLDYHCWSRDGSKSTRVAQLSVVSLTGRHATVDSRPVAVHAPLALCLALLEQCQEEHAGCTEGVESELPTRILDIGAQPKDHVRLVESNGLRGRYVTLSHCWGSTRPLVTDSTTYASHSSGISFSSLPSTYQDAVTVTRALGHRYLWIDSLCIIQDSKTDWETQCVKMDSIYQKSSITVAALSSTSATTGFLNQPRTVTDHMYCLSARADSAIDLAFGPYNRRPLDGWTDCPLFERAWVQQERALSRRLLCFRSDGLVFVCREHEARESVWPIEKSRSLAGKLSAHISGEEAVRQSWYELVGGYSGTQLTFRTDKLPAISGMARRFQQMKAFEDKSFGHDEYLAGMWRSDLPRQLLWYVFTMYPTAAVQEKEYIAPSWSWASNSNPISWKDRGQGKPPLTQYKYATIVSASTTTAGLDELGQVTSGKLIIRGKLQELVIGPALRRAYETTWEVRKLSRSQTEKPNGKFWSDAAGDEVSLYGIEGGLRVPCLLLHDDPHDPTMANCTYALALKSLGKGLFCRIGLVEMEEDRTIEDFWSDAEMLEITIV